MSRLRYSGVTGTIGSGNLTNSATSHTFTAPLTYSAGVTLPTLAGTDYFMLSILDTSGNLSEILKVTAYNQSSGAATIVRAQLGTTGVSHTSGDKVTLAAYPDDFSAVALDIGESVPATAGVGALVYRKSNWITSLTVDSPVALITLDESSGNFLDQSGNANHFTPGTGVTRSKTALLGDGGAAASGDGSHPIASLGSAGGISGTGTLECWAKLPSGSLQGNFIHVGATGNGWGISIGNGAGGAGRLLTATAGGINFLSSSYSFPAPIGSRSAIYHIAMTLSAHVYTWFVNGVVVGTNTISESSPGANLYIGGGPENLGSTIDVDHAAFYSTVLSDARIKQHAFQQPYTPLGWWDGSKLQPLGLA